MDEFLALGHSGSVETTLPSLELEGYESPANFTDWVLENGVTEPRLDARAFDEGPGLDVAERRLPSNRYQALGDWMNTPRRVRPIDVLIGILLFAVVAFGTAQVLAPAPPTLPPLSEMG